jgi:putative peptide zinc metalloprotease protein
MSAERPTFSPLWHRVRALKPRLRPHVQINRQFYRGRRWHVVHDPASNQFYRLSPVGHEMVGLLDGSRTVEDVWNLCLGSHGDAAPTQGEVIEMLGQMYNANLLAIDTTPETEQLLSRGRERVKRRIASQAIGIMYFRVRLFNPDRYLSWLEPILRPLINPVGFVLWVAWVVWGLVVAFQHWDDLHRAFTDAVAPSQWASIFVVFVLIKAIHETGHGVICKRFGGQVPEFGAMLLVLLPSPYVDASATWAFPSKWQRMAVGAGGMIFELAVAAGAAHYWAATLHAGSPLLHKLAFNAMFTASVTTLLFNANPLMRFDGYYILSDLLEVPNLMQRSMKMLQHLAQRFIYGVERTRPPSAVPAEQWILTIYGILALAYRLIIFFSITLYMMGQMYAIGVILAIWTAAAWFLIPLGKFAHWLAAGGAVSEHRTRAVLTSIGLGIVGLVGLGLVPMPDHRRASGVVESLHLTGLYFKTDGFVTTAHVHVGDRVKKGDPILTCSSHEMESALQRVEGQIAEYRIRERQYTKDDPAQAQTARDWIAAAEQLASTVRERLDGLVVRAPHDGVIALGVGGTDPQTVIGAYVKRGQLLCYVVDPDHLRVAAALTTVEAEPLLALQGHLHEGSHDVEVRPLSAAERAPIQATSVRIDPAGQKTLPHPALGQTGGGTIELDPQDKLGLSSKTPQFIAHIEADGLGLPGQRVKVRFSLPWRPLLSQWIDHVKRRIQGRVDI